MYATVTIKDDVEVIIEVTDINKSCKPYNYKYGIEFNLSSSSISKSDYDINLVLHFYSTLGDGDQFYVGTYNLTNKTNKKNIVLENLKVFSTNLPIDCENLTLEDIGLYKMDAEHWGIYQTSEFTPNKPLPIELLYFSHTLDQNDVVLNWVTATETNNDYFTIERSIDGINYQTVQTVKGAGNSTRRLDYQWVDEGLSAGTYYYRLRQTDFDGKFEVFGPIGVYININSPSELVIYPNPTQNGLTIISFDKPTSGTVNIYTTYGEVIKEESFQAATSMPLQINGEQGVYFANFILENGKTIQKKIVVH